MSRILLLYASVGTGHMTAAKALAEAFRADPANEVRIEDTLDYGSAAFRALYAQSFLSVTNYAPRLWKLLYDRSDFDDPGRIASASWLRAAIERFGVTRLERLIQQYDPTIVVCTHPLPADLLMRSRDGTRRPVFVVVTDHVAHATWIVPGVAAYCVPSELPRQLLIARGVPAERVHVTGIPVSPEAAQPKDRADARYRRALPPDLPVICLFGGGLATERVRRMVRGILEIEQPGQLVVVAGRNPELAGALAELRSGRHMRLRVEQYVDYVDDLLAACDLAITKAGGLIVSEVLARGRPLLVVDPIPGQEEWNADYVVGMGAGQQLRMPEAVPLAVRQLLVDGPRLASMAARAKHAGRPQAAHDIAAFVAQSGRS
jgi:processive 1,2-diacylglycerol beta-glucosyltransferase